MTLHAHSDEDGCLMKDYANITDDCVDFKSMIGMQWPIFHSDNKKDYAQL